MFDIIREKLKEMHQMMLRSVYTGQGRGCHHTRLKALYRESPVNFTSRIHLRCQDCIVSLCRNISFQETYRASPLTASQRDVLDYWWSENYF